MSQDSGIDDANNVCIIDCKCMKFKEISSFVFFGGCDINYNKFPEIIGSICENGHKS